MTDIPQKGDRWKSLNPKHRENSACRVMSNPIEGWVLARYRGAMPFLVHVSDWPNLFVKAADQKAETSKTPGNSAR